jgi:hypothetical protein
MSSEYSKEDSLELVRQLWERVEFFNSLISEQLIEAQVGERGARETLQGIDEAMHPVLASVISTGQTIYYDCKLPRQPAHTFNRGYVCKSDSDHKFCRSHALIKCVICGGDLK